MLIRLTTEMKDAFLLVVRLVALYQVEEARRLIVAQVLEQWELTQTQKPAFGALRRYAGDVSSCSS